ncbi:hypothetical protein D6D54_00160 [Spiroplasma poulsonii]|uniref:Lipoprotein n=1 Tax=Spiroplasma poulsonii TaxID=2138 RepID=A0A433ESR5_9MOLU|nr:lipoprotein [Spiroplasma poulsonii]MBW3058479.1 hypothetical protein [Spiroplasma poulsonii]RUP77955.1 hypothetical protein D6D54_00160 [Spiroplasma poulsonii]
MKKLLAIVGAFGLIATGATTVVACNKGPKMKDTLGGLKASDFAEVLLGIVEGKLNYDVIRIVANTVKDNKKNKEIDDNVPLFRNAFVVTYKLAEGVIFPLAKDNKITLTIKKATDDQIKDCYKKDTNKEMPVEALTIAKKIQGYVSGTEFSSEITVKEEGTATVDISGVI